jgi:hypothetical protein
MSMSATWWHKNKVLCVVLYLARGGGYMTHKAKLNFYQGEATVHA